MHSERKHAVSSDQGGGYSFSGGPPYPRRLQKGGKYAQKAESTIQENEVSLYLIAV